MGAGAALAAGGPRWLGARCTAPLDLERMRQQHTPQRTDATIEEEERKLEQILPRPGRGHHYQQNQDHRSITIILGSAVYK